MRKGLSRHGYRSSGNFFSPASLFANGEQGAWYDPSDLTTLFQDSAGTTPVTAVEQSVGLMLDKSKGGRQSLPITGWAQTSGDGVVTVNGGTITITGATTTTRVDIAAPGWVVGNYADITINGTVSGAVSPLLFIGGSPLAIVAGTNTYRSLISGSNLCRVQVTSGSATFDITSRGIVPGNHAYQSTSTSRPVLRARYNLLTYSENLNDTGWSTLFGGTGTTPTVTSNYATAPDGTITASRFVGTRGASNTTSDYSLSVSPNAVSVSGASYTGSIYIKSNTGSNQNVTIYIVTGASIQQSIAVAGSSWTRITPSDLTATATPCNIVIGTRGGSYGGDQSLDILVWGAQLIVTNSLTSNAYQRIADAATYDTAGFLPYLAFDGTDDSLLTNSVDFSATDKMTVWAGVRKLSTSTGIFTELSADNAANNGSFLIGTDSGGIEYFFNSRGTANQQVNVNNAAYDSPVTNVLQMSGNISGPSVSARINAVDISTNTGSQGTGNYGNYPLYIGRRNNATFPFNGQLFSLIIRGAQSTASQISATEAWVNGKTGAY